MANPLNTGNSLATNFNAVNQLMTDVKNDQSVRIIKDNKGTPVVILDQDGLRTTTPGGGIDVTAATNAQFTFNSNQDVFKIVQSKNTSIAITTSTGTTTKTIPHGLSYIPALLAYITDSSGTNYQALPALLSWSNSATAVTVGAMGFASVDATNVYIQVTVAGSTLVGSTLNVKYYLLQETAS